jgi:hypothetical protein
MNSLAQIQTLLMKKVTIMKNIQQKIMMPPYKGQTQRQNLTWKPRNPNEQRIHNTLAPTNVIDPEEDPWCLPCGDTHWEHEFPRNSFGDGGLDYMKFLDTLYPIYTISFEEYFNVTQEQLEKRKKEVVGKARIDIFIQMDEESRERLRKKDLQVYDRQNNAP